jgi:alpha-glucosidase (family GH31 glycosyl hydrolase)
VNTAVSDLSRGGIQVTVYINPHLNSEGQIFKEAESLGYLLKDTNNQTYKENFGEFLAGTIDFSNPLAKQWYSGKC